MIKLEDLLNILDVNRLVYVYKNNSDDYSNIMFCSYLDNYYELIKRYAKWNVVNIKVHEDIKAIDISISKP